ncbi:MAG: hypothetical protein L7F78_15595 [Syntrophales bacterium LBB04]|nr:hypothetical protein [Syntrophales bacterium LBB04]
MELIDLKEKEGFQKQGRGFAKLVDEPYLQINQACLEPGQGSASPSGELPCNAYGGPREKELLHRQ